MAAHGIQVQVLPADLSTESGRETVAGVLVDPSVDLLVTNAGLSLNTPFLRSTPQRETELLNLNVHAVMRLTLAAAPVMASRGHGAILNVSSVSVPGRRCPAHVPGLEGVVTNFSESVALLGPGYVRPVSPATCRHHGDEDARLMG